MEAHVDYRRRLCVSSELYFCPRPPSRDLVEIEYLRITSPYEGHPRVYSVIF